MSVKHDDNAGYPRDVYPVRARKGRQTRASVTLTVDIVGRGDRSAEDAAAALRSGLGVGQLLTGGFRVVGTSEPVHIFTVKEDAA